jgi:hypothetical protein
MPEHNEWSFVFYSDTQFSSEFCFFVHFLLKTLVRIYVIFHHSLSSIISTSVSTVGGYKAILFQIFAFFKCYLDPAMGASFIGKVSSTKLPVVFYCCRLFMPINVITLSSYFIFKSQANHPVVNSGNAYFCQSILCQQLSLLPPIVFLI